MKKYIIANWKMSGTSAGIADYIACLTKYLTNKRVENELTVIICAPHVYLSTLKDLTKELSISVGGQDCHTHTKGAFTGETSAEMLADIGCKYVLIGHSERRKYNGEDESILKNKVIMAQNAGLIPILCVGESLVEREQNATLEVLKRQISILDEVKGETLIAYEPDWAIGTGVTPKFNDIQTMCNTIASEYHKLTGKDAYILYGGSVNAENVLDFMQSEDVDGVLVGKASLLPESFGKIIEIGAQAN
ncbi:MAG: triose-phosphate isomerase [Holosporales bacterium]|nr:triose-phosphate isomerase [Holosporales bacterium]